MRHTMTRDEADIELTTDPLSCGFCGAELQQMVGDRYECTAACGFWINLPGLALKGAIAGPMAEGAAR